MANATVQVLEAHLREQGLGSYVSWVQLPDLPEEHADLVARILRDRPRFESFWMPGPGVAVSQEEVARRLGGGPEWTPEVRGAFQAATRAVRSLEDGGRRLVCARGCEPVLAARLRAGTDFEVLNALPEGGCQDLFRRSRSGQWSRIAGPEEIPAWVEDDGDSNPSGQYALGGRGQLRHLRSDAVARVRRRARAGPVLLRSAEGDTVRMRAFAAAAAAEGRLEARGESALLFGGRPVAWEAERADFVFAGGPAELLDVLFGRLPAGMVLGGGGELTADEELERMRQDIRDRLVDGLKTAVKLDRSTQNTIASKLQGLRSAMVHMARRSKAVSGMVPPEALYCTGVAELIGQVAASGQELGGGFLDWASRCRDSGRGPYRTTNVPPNDAEMSGRFVYRVLLWSVLDPKPEARG